MQDMIAVLKDVGSELDSLHNASTFHQVISRLTWSKEVVDGDMIEVFTRINFRLFTNHAYPDHRSRLKYSPYKLGFDFWWDPKNDKPDLYMRFGLYAVEGHVCQQTNLMSIETFVETSSADLCKQLLAKARPSSAFREHISIYYGYAVDSGWLEDVRKCFEQRLSVIESCL